MAGLVVSDRPILRPAAIATFASYAMPLYSPRQARASRAKHPDMRKDISC